MAGDPENIKPFEWKKGQSGNPGGRPKGIQAKAREHTDKAIEVLVNGLDDKDPKVRVAAAKELIDRGWGKAIQMTADISEKLDDLDDDVLNAAIATLRAAIGAPDQTRSDSDRTPPHPTPQ